MREFSFNDACVEGAFSSPQQAYDTLSSISTGMASLVDAGLTQAAIRYSKPVHEILLTSELSLYDAILQLTKNVETRDQGTFLKSLSNKIPLEDELEDGSFERIASWELKDYPGCLGLLLCASSDRIAVSATIDRSWHRDFFEVTVVRPDDVGGATEECCEIGNVHSEKIDPVKRAIIEEGIGNKSANEIWGDRKALFPNLIFAPSVQGNLSSLGDVQFSQAVTKLQQLNASASKWHATPSYVLFARGESESTMNRYGKLRQFTGEDGGVHVYELHVSVTAGYRMHFRELPASKKIEIGYVGPHLKVSKRN